MTPTPTSTSSPASSKGRARTKTEQMRAERAAAAVRARRRQRILTVAGVAVIVGLLAAIVLAVMHATSGSGRPANAGKVVVPATVVDGAIPVGDANAPVTVDLYLDYMCPACGAFDRVNAADLGQLAKEGTVRVNLRLMNFLDPQSGGTEYSTRAGNAVAAAANDAPDAVWGLHTALYANQPREGGAGLSDDQIADLAVAAGVPAAVADSFTDGTYHGWVDQSDAAATASGVNSTPTVKIDGKTFEGNWTVPGELAAAIVAAAGTR